MKNNNTLIIADLHEPFTKEGYFDFCRDVARKYNTKRTVFIGDIVDNHAMSYHEHDPNGWGPEQELNYARSLLKKWYKEYPQAYWTYGNHDELINRKAKTYGIPSSCIKGIREILGTPRGWRADFSFNFGNWRAQHGTQSSGDNGAFMSMLHQGICIVQGHIHTASGVRYHANEARLLWAMQLGWGGDRKAYAFSYGRDFKRKPILSCGVVLENGTLPIVIPMPL